MISKVVLELSDSDFVLEAALPCASPAISTVFSKLSDVLVRDSQNLDHDVSKAACERERICRINQNTLPQASTIGEKCTPRRSDSRGLSTAQPAVKL